MGRVTQVTAHKYRVAVAGASGYAGGEFLRLASRHPNLEIGALTAHSNAGTKLGVHHPHLRSLADRVLCPTTPQELAGHDVVVLALPHGASGEIAAQLPPDVVVLDLGADHRLESEADWVKYYGSAHAGTWVYGMPELMREGASQRERLAGATRIAVPGCNVTAVTLGLQPGIAAGVIEKDDLVAVLANGYSGAGKALKPHLAAAEALGSAAPYAVGGSHRHIPEILQNLRHAAVSKDDGQEPTEDSGRGAGGAGGSISFTPTLVPMSRGILATATARLNPWLRDRLTDDADPSDVERDVRAAWTTAYRDEPFVELLPEGQWPTTALTLGVNTALVQVAVDVAAGRVVTVTAIDNLVKGTAGGAIQALNLALGLPETTGLITEGVAP